MRDRESLAAEVEAVLRKHVRLNGREKWDEPYYSLIGFPEAAAEIAALQSRAFEDRERSMRQRAKDLARAWAMPDAPPTADEILIARVQARNETVAGIAAGIAALQPEGERNA